MIVRALDSHPWQPFDCTWEDAIGGHQGAYARETGWSGSAIQLQCGDYEGLRFHLRLFRAGERTIVNAHFETIIPATTEHQVLSWELAEQFAVGDLGRTGVLSASTVPDELHYAVALPRDRTGDLQSFAGGAEGSHRWARGAAAQPRTNGERRASHGVVSW